MIVSFDNLSRFEEPVITLCNPGSYLVGEPGHQVMSNSIGILAGVTNFTIDFNFNATHQLSFDYSLIHSDDSKTQSVLSSIYDGIQVHRCLFVENIGFFLITDVTDSNDTHKMKSVTAASCEKELEDIEAPYLGDITETINGEEKHTYGNYMFKKNPGSTEFSVGFIDEIQTVLPKYWSIGYIDESLYSTQRNFSDNQTDDLYTMLWQDGEEAFEYIIDVDCINRKLNFYSRAKYAENHITGIFLNRDNLINKISSTEGIDSYYTALYVTGGENDDTNNIRCVNPIGTNTIYDFSHHKGWMSPALRIAIEKWTERIDRESAADNQNNYYNKSLNLYTLKAEMETAQHNLDTAQKAFEIKDTELINAYAHNGDDVAKQKISDAYNEARNKRDECKNLLKTAQDEYNSALNEVESVISTCKLDLNATDISGNKIFTEDLLKELTPYIRQSDYNDEYIVYDDTMDWNAKFEKSLELYNRAKYQLGQISTGKREISVECDSFLFNETFEPFSKQLEVGSIIYVQTDAFSNDAPEQLHLTTFHVDYSGHQMTMTFGNKYDRYDIKALYEDVFGEAKKAASQISFVREIIDQQTARLSECKSWIDNAFTLTADNVITCKNQTFVLDDKGYLGKQYELNSDGTIKTDQDGIIQYSNRQCRLISNGLYLTEDNWESVSAAIGELHMGDDDNGEPKYGYGVIADKIIGKMIVGQSLTVAGGCAYSDGEYGVTIDENGICILNGGSSECGLTIKNKNKETVFSADNDGNLVITGKINALSGGKIGGWEIKSDRLLCQNPNNENQNVRIQCPSDWSAGTEDNKTVMCVQNGKNYWPFFLKADGSLYATKGSIGGWELSSYGLEYATNQFDGDGNKIAYTRVGITSPSSYGNVIYVKAFNANHEQEDVPFRLHYDGTMYAVKAHIRGEIIATSGRIGGCTIANGQLRVPAAYIDGTLSANQINTNSLTITDGMINGVSLSKITGGTNGNYCEFGNIKATGEFVTSANDCTTNIKSGQINCYRGAEHTNMDGVGFTLYDSSGYIFDIVNTSSGVHIGGNATIVGNIRSTSGTAVSSDKNVKNSICEYSNAYDVLFDNLKPISYKYNNGTSDRTHTGFIAQDVEDAILLAGLTSQDFAGLVISDMGTENEERSLRYGEFVSLNTWQIQKLKKRLAEIEKKLLAIGNQP